MPRGRLGDVYLDSTNPLHLHGKLCIHDLGNVDASSRGIIRAHGHRQLPQGNGPNHARRANLSRIVDAHAFLRKTALGGGREIRYWHSEIDRH